MSDFLFKITTLCRNKVFICKDVVSFSETPTLDHLGITETKRKGRALTQDLVGI
jgi:hypothetical protein